MREPKVLYSFVDCVLDPQRRELRRGNSLVSVQPQVFDLLLYLIRNRERVISKDELIDAIWEGRAVSDTVVSSRMHAARQAIGDDGDAQRLIQTIQRKGTRFVGNVREADRTPGPLKHEAQLAVSVAAADAPA